MSKPDIDLGNGGYIPEGESNGPEGIPPELLTNPEKYEEQIPTFKRMVGFVKQFETAKEKGKVQLFEGLGSSIAKHPQMFGQALDSLVIIGQLRPRVPVEYLSEQMIQHAEQAVAHRSQLPSWSPDKIEELIRLGLDTTGKLPEIVDRLKAALFNAPQTVNDSIDLHYNATWAMVTTQYEDVREELFSILCYEKEWFSPGADAVFYFSLGKWASDDIHLGRYYMLGNVIAQVGRYLETDQEGLAEFSIRNEERKDILQAMGDPEYALPSGIEATIRRAQVAAKLANRNPQRFQALWDFYSHPYPAVDPLSQAQVSRLITVSHGETYGAIKKRDDVMRDLPWPANCMLNLNDPLWIQMLQTFTPRFHRSAGEHVLSTLKREGFLSVTTKGVQVDDDIRLDIVAEKCTTQEQKNAIAREVIGVLLHGEWSKSSREAITSFEKALELTRAFSCLTVNPYDKKKSVYFILRKDLKEAEIGRLSSIVEYHRPSISIDQLAEANNTLNEVKADLKNKYTRAVGRRGYSVAVADHVLRQLGYEAIIFKQNPDRGITTNISIDGEDYEIKVDGNYRVVPGGDITKFQTVQDQVWIELLVLSHLKKVMCTEADEDSMKQELVGGARQYEYYKHQTINRAEHLRRMAPGNNYSQQQFGLCLESELPDKNLELINRKRAEVGWGGTRETGIWTYVRPVEKVDVPQTEPIKVAYAHAADDIQKVIPLGRVSDEELLRIEEEIFGEFFAT